MAAPLSDQVLKFNKLHLLGSQRFREPHSRLCLCLTETLSNRPPRQPLFFTVGFSFLQSVLLPHRVVQLLKAERVPLLLE